MISGTLNGQNGPPLSPHSVEPNVVIGGLRAYLIISEMENQKVYA